MQMAKSTIITLIALAPLSNIEALARRDPQALQEFRQVVMMGGSVFEGIRAYWNAEHNELYAFKVREHLLRLKATDRHGSTGTVTVRLIVY